jgi:DNA-binding Lrp family transcriptional regulator
MNLDEHILQVLGGRVGLNQPLTFHDFARRFGISATVVAPAARRLVDAGLATASTVIVDGVPTLHGLTARVPTDPPR